MGQTLIEKILTNHVTKNQVHANDYITAEIDLAFSHDNTHLICSLFKRLGGKKIWDPKKIVIALDHRSPANTCNTAKNQKQIRRFVKDQGIPHFYDIGEGIGHQLLVEKGHCLPGTIIVGSDSHTTTLGALGAFATGIGATDMAVVWHEGRLWFKIPKSIKIVIRGIPLSYITAKDISLYLVGLLGASGANYRSCEFSGNTIKTFDIADRMCLANMMMETGAKNALFPVDLKTKNYLKPFTTKLSVLSPDNDAIYEKIIHLNINNMQPQIACPSTVDNVKPIYKVSDIYIDQIVIGSCTNGRLKDISLAASIIGNHKIAKNIRLLIIPASRTVFIDAINNGSIQTLVHAGAVILPPGCGPCLGLHQGVVAPGDIVLATTNRNFIGRMGASTAKIYLCSPSVAAASAITGRITHPEEIVI